MSDIKTCRVCYEPLEIDRHVRCAACDDQIHESCAVHDYDNLPDKHFCSASCLLAELEFVGVNKKEGVQ